MSSFIQNRACAQAKKFIYSQGKPVFQQFPLLSHLIKSDTSLSDIKKLSDRRMAKPPEERIPDPSIIKFAFLKILPLSFVPIVKDLRVGSDVGIIP